MAGMSLAPSPSFCSQHRTSKLGASSFMGKFCSRKAYSQAPTSSRVNSAPRSIPHNTMSNSSPFTIATPTRRPKPADNAPPPAYSPPGTSAPVPGPLATSSDSPYAFLTQFDTIFLIDDSGSMAGRSWRETSAALTAITPICTAHDADGIDIYFLNHKNPLTANVNGGYMNITTTAGVENIFNSVRPLGGTPTGTRLNNILKPYLAEVENDIERQAHGHDSTIKPLNIIVVTDGVPSDDVESVIVSAAKKLDAWGAEPWQVGIQFFQVGREPDAAEDLRELDDALSAAHGIRDMVDTVPWSGDDGAILTADGILKCVLGAVHKKLDRRRGSDDRLRR